jgi:hypothetical protein
MQINTFSPFSPEYMRIDRSKEEDEPKAGIETQEQGSDTSEEKSPVQKSSDDMRTAELQQADTEVRAHEAAHLAAGGGVVTGGANFSYTKGPDGKMYATAGEVPIDTSEESTPEATIQKARQIAAAAMAPSDPSPTDYRVAASAVVMEMRARMEMIKEQMELLKGTQSYGMQTGTSESDTNTIKRDDPSKLIDPAA